MKKVIFSLIIFFNLFICIASANKLSKIELIDGSVIIGEVSGINNGKYTVNSQEMGVLQIEASRIKQIILADPETNPALSQLKTDNPSANDMETLKNKILADKETMGMITSLQNDPQFQAILNDPEIVKAAKTGDTASLMNNSKILQLQNNPIIQEIKNRTDEEKL